MGRGLGPRRIQKEESQGLMLGRVRARGAMHKCGSHVSRQEKQAKEGRVWNSPSPDLGPCLVSQPTGLVWGLRVCILAGSQRVADAGLLGSVQDGVKCWVLRSLCVPSQCFRRCFLGEYLKGG
jgi:hypothetical protein